MASIWEPPEEVRRRECERMNELMESLKRQCTDAIMEGRAVAVSIEQEAVELEPEPGDGGLVRHGPGPEVTYSVTIENRPTATREET